MSWFDPIKNAAETIFSDLHNIFAPGGGGFTQANFVKLGMDIQKGVEVDIQQIEIGLKAVEVGIQQAIPVAQQAIADAQLVAAVYPAVEPFIVEMQAGLSAVQALDTVLLNAKAPDPTNIPSGIVALAGLSKSIASWAGDAVQAVKKATPKKGS